MDVGYGWFRVSDSAMVQVRGELFCGLIQTGTNMDKGMKGCGGFIIFL